jgi:HPt (histidine-containing phosphotransfer) domain-containing protein
MADKVYDLIQLEELSGGDQDFVNMMVDTFLEHTPGQLEELISAQAINDMATFGAISHKIKPNVDMFGIKKIIQDVRDLEQLGKAGQNNDELKTKLENVKSELTIAFEQLRQR